jgi:starch phosphorylase
VVPTYYNRDSSGLPTRWIQKAKRSMATLLPAFNTRRMLANYVAGMYRPAAAHGRRLQSDGCAAAGQLAAWRERAAQAWPGVQLRLASQRPERVAFGDHVQMRVAVQLNGLQPSEARVELLLTREMPDGAHEPPLLTSFGGDERVRVRDGHLTAIELFQPTGEEEPDGSFVYAIECTPPWCGQLGAEVRAVPQHPLLAHPYEAGLMRWL